MDTTLKRVWTKLKLQPTDSTIAPDKTSGIL